MLEKFKTITNKRYFHLVVIIIILVVLIFISGVIILRYQVEGETNMPFQLSKISIISSSEGIDKQATDTKWAFDVCQNNDIFLYIDKNENYGKTEAIQSINISGIEIESLKKENIKIYKPDEKDEKLIFKNKEENIIENMTYTGEMKSNLKQLKISNQGGIIALRCSNEKLANYTSNEEEIKHQELLKKAGVTIEDLQAKMKFILTIQLASGIQYQSEIRLELPIEDVIEKGTTSREITDMKDFIFKRVNN